MSFYGLKFSGDGLGAVPYAVGIMVWAPRKMMIFWAPLNIWGWNRVAPLGTEKCLDAPGGKCSGSPEGASATN